MNIRRPAAGFSLIELLVVVAIIAAIISFAVPATNELLRGSQLTQGSQALSDQMAFARQMALSRNRPVELRFYKYADLETPGEDVAQPETWNFRAFQLFEVLENGATLPLGAVQRLPLMVVADPDRYSTLLQEDLRGKPIEAKDDDTAPELPIKFQNLAVGRNYQYMRFRYLPDGSTDLPPSTKPRAGSQGTTTSTTDDSWYITLMGLNDLKKDVNSINFFTVQIDPLTGALKQYRPGG